MHSSGHRLATCVYLFHPIQGEIWCLHRVVEKRSDYPSNRELEITPDYLERLITNYKSEGFEFTSIDQLVRSKSLIPKKQVNISFDDGFRDVYQNSFPVFIKYNIPFTLYLTTPIYQKARQTCGGSRWSATAPLRLLRI